MNDLRTTIGLEVHVQLATATKLFSPAGYAALAEPNTHVHAIDVGLPGVLPVANARAIALAVRAALALSGAVQERSRFARKHYFYPDLPKGYQISQYEQPYCRGGRVPLGGDRHCPLTRIHLEEDAGKLTHTDAGTLVDLNRAGVPLIEIVSEPDLHDPEDAHAFLVHLREILRYAGVSDCDMELGSLRCDANISLAKAGAPLGTKVEIKNLNSFKMVQRALEYEQRRQATVLATGGSIVQETRLWNEEQGETRPMRSKEFAEDYRYFPDPDLPPLCIDAALIEQQRAAVGELPHARRRRYREQYQLPDYDVEQLTADRAVGDWFERVVQAGAPTKAASNWLMSDVLPACKERQLDVAALPLGPATLAELIAAVEARTITLQSGKRAFQHLLTHGGTVAATIDALGLQKVVDPAVLGPIVDEAIAASPRAVEAFRAGQQKALDALKGPIMRATKGRADAATVDRLLRERLR